MRTLARRIDCELRSKKRCAIYESELQRVWPLFEEDRETKIARFATEYGFLLTFYKPGECAIFREIISRPDTEHEGTDQILHERLYV